MPVPEINQPCSRCACDDFIVLDDVALEIWVSGSHYGATDPALTMVTCARCGRTEWFANDTATLARHDGARRVRIGDGGYRSPG